MCSVLRMYMYVLEAATYTCRPQKIFCCEANVDLLRMRLVHVK